ncbi:MAG TPA: hypothetical protein VF482_04750, partial [Trebonia sp.]
MTTSPSRVPAPAPSRLPVLLPPAAGSSWGGRLAAPITFALFGLADILLFGGNSRGKATFAFSQEFAKVTVPNLA